MIATTIISSSIVKAPRRFIGRAPLRRFIIPLGVDDLAVGPVGQQLRRSSGLDPSLEESDRAVAEGEIGAAGMLAAVAADKRRRARLGERRRAALDVLVGRRTARADDRRPAGLRTDSPSAEFRRLGRVPDAQPWSEPSLSFSPTKIVCDVPSVMSS